MKKRRPSSAKSKKKTFGVQEFADNLRRVRYSVALNVVPKLLEECHAVLEETRKFNSEDDCPPELRQRLFRLCKAGIVAVLAPAHRSQKGGRPCNACVSNGANETQ